LEPSLLRRTQIDIDCWDDLISRSPQSVIYAHSFYLDIVCQDWQALVWPGTGPYEIAMPVPVRRKFGCTVVYQPLFCQFLGMFSARQLTATQAEAFVKAISANFSYISSYCFNPENTAVLAPFLCNYRQIEPALLTTEWLDLNRGYECIHTHFSEDRKLNVRKSHNQCWNIISFNNIHPVISLFAANHAHTIPGGVSNNAYCLLEKLFEVLCKKGFTDLRYAHREGVLHAGVLFVRYAGRVIYLFNAADETGRLDNARTFLLDQYFRQNAESNLVFDFEAPEKESVLKFYKSFGGKSVPFFRISQNRLPFPFRQICRLRKIWLQKKSISLRKPL
jgi:hypothetical protein